MNLKSKNFFVRKLNENDRSKQIYIEAGYYMEDGYLEINL